jgi:1D-myo-inositol 3-kinase
VEIDFLAIGHATHDRTPDGFRRGGTVCYAAVTAQRLGRSPGILTRASSDGLLVHETPGRPENAAAPRGSELEGISIRLLPSSVNTTFVNIYHDGKRTQVLESLAEPISVSDLPAAWSAVPVVLLGPIAGELGPDWVDQFPNSIMGITPQGWMRKWDERGHVSSAPWVGAERCLHRADVVVLSREDVGGDERVIADLAAQARTLLVTDGWRPVELHVAGARHRLPTRQTREVDPTGAGDVFAAGYLVGLAETGDPLAAARFAIATASMSIEGLGMAAIPDRARVDEWLIRQG